MKEKICGSTILDSMLYITYELAFEQDKFFFENKQIIIIVANFTSFKF